MPGSIELTLVLRQPLASKAISERLLAGTYDPSQVRESDLAADPSDVEAVTQFAAGHQLQVVKIDPAARTVKVAGSMEAIQTAFGISADLQPMDYKGPIELPPPLNQIVIAVLGLDRTPIARAHSQ